MKTKETKTKKYEKKNTVKGNTTRIFQGMYEMKNKCCSGRGVQSDWQDTMEKTMGTYCSLKTENTKKE